MRIVLVDDDSGFRESFADILRGHDHEVYTFDNPNICPLQMMPECRCNENEVCTDVIITDLKMPLIDGLEFIKAQKAKHCRCHHIVLVSCNITEGDMQAADSLGCAIFTKPIDIDRFIEWLNNLEITPDRVLRDWFKTPE